MKKKVSITIDDNTVSQIEKVLEHSIFRNRSHLVEVALKEFLGGYE